MLDYPDHSPPYSEKPVWYEVECLYHADDTDRDHAIACWWWDHWYCFAGIVKSFNPNMVEGYASDRG